MTSLKAYKVIALTLTVSLYSTSSWCWSHHHRITEIALSSLKNIHDKKVTVSDFSEILKDQEYLLQDLAPFEKLKYEDVQAYDKNLTFNENIKINKNYKFATEVVGSTLSVSEILSKYSDEPDWGMDQLLFNKDQYPQIWKSNYTYMGGSDSSDPVPTQAFRHMYWEKWNILHPTNTFKLPTFSEMGQAPIRASIFLALSRRAKERHHEYWSARFLANALHYLEDVSQPFHSAQTPTKLFWLLPFSDSAHGDGFNQFVLQVTHIITYYHFNFEDYVARLLEKYIIEPKSAPEAELFVSALSPTESENRGSNPKINIFNLVKKMSSLAVNQASKAGRASFNFFPPMPPGAKFSTFGGEAAINYMNEDYWHEVFLKGEASSPEKEAYFEVIKKMFLPLGVQIRALVKGEGF